MRQGELAAINHESRSTRFAVHFMKEPGLDNRHRDKNGEISRKHGNTLIKTLRKIYGTSFAPGFYDHQKLEDVLATIPEASLSQLIKDHEAGTLAHKISVHA